MKFVHEDPEFSDLLQIVSRDRRLAVSLVEKDYWGANYGARTNLVGARYITQGTWTTKATRAELCNRPSPSRTERRRRAHRVCG